MELHIFGLKDAIGYVPYVPTYAMRIFSSWHGKKDKFSLVTYPNYIRTIEYVFDDNDASFQTGPKWIDEEMDHRMINDFRNSLDDVEDFMVHCNQGENRSSAVGIAFNEIFDLGADRDQLRDRYGAPAKFNRHTCGTLLYASGWNDKKVRNFLIQMCKN